jgi:hypothetical protein
MYPLFGFKSPLHFLRGDVRIHSFMAHNRVKLHSMTRNAEDFWIRMDGMYIQVVDFYVSFKTQNSKGQYIKIHTHTKFHWLRRVSPLWFTHKEMQLKTMNGQPDNIALFSFDKNGCKKSKFGESLSQLNPQLRICSDYRCI